MKCTVREVYDGGSKSNRTDSVLQNVCVLHTILALILISTVLIYDRKISVVYNSYSQQKKLICDLKYKESRPLMSSIEQRYNMKFCVLLGKLPSESYNLITQAYQDEALLRTQVFEWHKRFREWKN